jgi:hypothetical protein
MAKAGEDAEMSLIKLAAPGSTFTSAESANFELAHCAPRAKVRRRSQLWVSKHESSD